MPMSVLPLTSDKPNPNAAAHHIQDALDGVQRVHPRAGRRPRLAHLASLWIKLPVRATLLALVVLSFFERPAWCAGSSPDPTQYLMSGIAVLRAPTVLVLEWLGIAILCSEVMLMVIAQGTARWCQERLQRLYSIVLLLTLIDLVVATSVWCIHGDESLQQFRFAAFLRMLLLITQSEQLRLQFYLINRTIPALTSIGLVLFAFLLVFAWAGTLFFQDTDEGRQYFPTLPEAAWSLLIALTTANFPDVMMPAYISWRGAVIFFATFELVGTLFLLNLITAVVYKESALSTHSVPLASPARTPSSSLHPFAPPSPSRAIGGHALCLPCPLPCTAAIAIVHSAPVHSSSGSF